MRLPKSIQTLPQLDSAHQDLRAQLVRQALAEEGWSLSRAARRLDTPYSSLARLLERYPEIDAERRERGPSRGRPQKNIATAQKTVDRY